MRKAIIFLLFAAFLYSPVLTVRAQDQTPKGPVYIVQPGDYLSTIARRFGISIDQLIQANGITDPNRISVGDQLIIPGLDGISGTLVTKKISFGATLASLSGQYQVPVDLLIRLNHITNPVEVYAGASLVVPQDESKPVYTGRTILSTGRTPLEIAASHGIAPWSLMADNGFANSTDPLPGDILFYADSTVAADATTISDQITQIDISPLPLVQGKTTEIKISTTTPYEFSGKMIDASLVFFETEDHQYAALQGVNAMLEPGLYPFILSGTQTDGSSFQIEQNILVVSGGYSQESLHNIDPATLDPKVTQPEIDLITSKTAPVTPDRLWQGKFRSPATYLEFTSVFGTRRSYNGGPFDTFHTGLDFAGGYGLPIYAPAAGRVVFTQELTVRGNATIIDHGWGVYSGFWHQSEIKVKEGDMVEPGQVIGLVGNTGRVQGAEAFQGAGAHLHWEIWVHGVQVDPMDWLNNLYP